MRSYNFEFARTRGPTAATTRVVKGSCRGASPSNEQSWNKVAPIKGNDKVSIEGVVANLHYKQGNLGRYSKGDGYLEGPRMMPGTLGLGWKSESRDRMKPMTLMIPTTCKGDKIKDIKSYRMLPCGCGSSFARWMRFKFFATFKSSKFEVIQNASLWVLFKQVLRLRKVQC